MVLAILGREASWERGSVVSGFQRGRANLFGSVLGERDGVLLYDFRGVHSS